MKMRNWSVLVFLTLAIPTTVAALSAAQDKGLWATVEVKKMKTTVERLEKPTTMELVATPIKEALSLIEDYSDLKLDAENWGLPDVRVSLESKDRPLAEVLQRVLDECDGTYAVKPNGQILIRPAPPLKRK